MKTFNINIFSTEEDYSKVKSEIEELILDQSNFTIYISREESELTEKSEIVINVEYPLFGGILGTMVEEHSNLNFSITTNWELSHIMNRIIIERD